MLAVIKDGGFLELAHDLLKDDTVIVMEAVKYRYSSVTSPS